MKFDLNFKQRGTLNLPRGTLFFASVYFVGHSFHRERSPSL